VKKSTLPTQETISGNDSLADYLRKSGLTMGEPHTYIRYPSLSPDRSSPTSPYPLSRREEELL
jgi:hypothetical protein